MKFAPLLLALLAAPAFAVAAPTPAPTPPLADILAAAPAFAPNHIGNIRRLIAAGFFDHVAIVRAQDNFVPHPSLRRTKGAYQGERGFTLSLHPVSEREVKSNAGIWRPGSSQSLAETLDPCPTFN